MYKRVLLKLSGEALKGNQSSQILDGECLNSMAKMMADLHNVGVQICVVIGAGNIWRGKIAEEAGLERVPADFMGMMGTVINAVAMSSSLKRLGVDSVVTSAIKAVPEVAVNYSKEIALQAFEENKVVFLAGGTGKPYCSTDTAATLRAIELDCDAILMGKNGVEGVFDSDPRKNKDAKLIKSITYKEIIELNLQVMDISAVELIKDKNIEIRVFSMDDPKNFIRVANGETIGTICKKGE